MSIHRNGAPDRFWKTVLDDTPRPVETRCVRVSQLTGNVNEMVLPVSKHRIEAWRKDEDSRAVQVAFPELNADQREFLLTGTTPEEWPPEPEDDKYIRDEDGRILCFVPDCGYPAKGLGDHGAPVCGGVCGDAVKPLEDE